MPEFPTTELYYEVLSDALSAIKGFVVALGWSKQSLPSMPSALALAPSRTQADKNMALIKHFFESSGLGMEGFDVGGVVPFWKSESMLSSPSLQSVDQNAIHTLMASKPRSLCVAEDRATFYIGGMRQFFVAARDEWSPKDRTCVLFHANS